MNVTVEFITDVRRPCYRPELTNLTKNQLHNVYVYYAMILHVSTTYFGYLHGAKSLICLFIVYGQLS